MIRLEETGLLKQLVNSMRKMPSTGGDMGAFLRTLLKSCVMEEDNHKL